MDRNKLCYMLSKKTYFQYFPIDDEVSHTFDYSESIWKYWEDAIKTIKDKPVKYSSVYDEFSGEEIGREIDDCEYIKLETISKMYGAMVVSLWSLMEEFLSSFVPYFDVIQKKKFVSNIKCDDFRFNKTLEKNYKKATGCELSRISYYQQVNDIRLLNNIFKHRNGSYNANNKQCQNLSANIKNKLGIDNDTLSMDIDYGKLNIKEYIEYFHKFAEEFVNNIDKKLKNLALI